MGLKKHQKNIEEKVKGYLNKGYDLYETLAEISQSELYSLLISVVEKKAKEKKVSTLLEEKKNNKFTKSSSISQSDFIQVDNIFINNIFGNYCSIELSPVAILGSNQITQTSQNKLLSTIRGLELTGDGCIQLAYHHASQDISNQEKDYITSHRVLRNQNFGKSIYTNHFRMLCLASHITNSNISIHLDKLLEHISMIINGIITLKGNNIIDYDNIVIEFSNLNFLNTLEKEIRNEVLEKLQEKKNIERKNIENDNLNQTLFDITKKDSLMIQQKKEFKNLDQALLRWENKPENIDIIKNHNRFSGIGHYNSYCYNIILKKGDNQTIIADGGITNRTGQLLHNHKNAFIVGGLGTEILLKIFKK